MRKWVNMKKFIEKLENVKASPFEWILAVFAFYFLRRLLDVIIEADSYKTFSPQIFVCSGLAYAGAFLGIVLILHISTKEKIEKVTKASFVFWPLLLLVPLIDWVFSEGKGYVLTYISPKHFWYEFLSFFGLFGSYHVTYGQTLAILIGFLLIIIYAFFKTKSIVRTSFAASGYYLLIYFYASPAVFFYDKINLGTFFVFLFTAALWLLTYNREKFFSFVRSMYWSRVAHYLGLCLFGVLVHSIQVGGIPEIESLMYSLVSLFFAFQCALLINAIYDRERVIYNKEESYFLCGTFALTSFLLSLPVNNTFSSVILIYLLIAFIYSAPPIRFKRFGYWNNLIIGFESALAFAAGFTSQILDIELMPLNMFASIFLIFSLAANVKDWKDYEKDKKEGIKTLPVLLGRERGLKAIALITSLCFPLSVIMFAFWELFLISILFGLINGILFLKFKKEYAVFACYYLFAIVVFLYLFTLKGASYSGLEVAEENGKFIAQCIVDV